ncbi:hypothetical protein PVAG01_08233 [Phlyctema vagabunda]|uniref:BTB domain-containing protein n=1 Tax=Phlyctema vagabunda TaxID=108571 RepID=A0ABR4P8V8_9HELO
MYDDGHRVDNIPVHKRFLTHYSHFFKRAFAPGTEETRRRAMRITVMRYVRPDVFQVYLGWVYSQQITMTPETTQTQQALVDLWRLAEKFATPRLQNQAADLLYAIMFRDGVDVALDLNHIYDSAHNQSPLRRVLVFAFASPALRWDMFTDAMLPKHLLFKLVKTYKQAHDARRDMAKPLNDEERMRQFHVIEEL